MNYEIFLAFLKNDNDRLYKYYEDNDIKYVDFILTLNNEFKKFFIEDDSRKNLTAFIIKKYLNNNLLLDKRLLAESKVAYCLTHIGLNGLENNPFIKNILANYHNELSKYIDINLKSITESNDNYYIQKGKNLKNLQIELSKINTNEKQKKLPSSIRALPEDMLDLRHNDLNDILNDNKKTEILNADLIVQIFHLPHNNDITEKQFTSFIDKTKKVRLKFAEIHVNKPYFSSLLSLINQDILYSFFYNHSTDGTSIELWDHIDKFSLNDIRLSKIESSLENKKFLFVLTKDNQLILSPFQQNNIHIRHIMLANGHLILTGGNMEFSSDMSKIISVDNGTGHYKVSFESLRLLKDSLVNSNYDVTETVLLDIISGKKELLIDINKILSNINDVRNDELNQSTNKATSLPL
jgi:hypothetical protein